MLYIGQRDKRWGSAKIGESEATIAEAGCTICSTLMELSKFYPERGFKNFYRPDEASRAWTFTGTKYDDIPKYINWILSQEAFRNVGMEFVWRNWEYAPDKIMVDPSSPPSVTHVAFQKDLLKQWLRSSNYGVIFQVKTKSGGQHWIAGVGKSLIGWVCNDPWYPKRLWAAPYPYVEITGWALFRKYE